MKPAIFSFIGASGSGKTTLICQLVSHFLQQGYRVGVVKHAMTNIELDKKGKDSWLFREQGAQGVLIHAPNQTAYITDADTEDSLIESLFTKFHDFDIVFVEGHKAVPKFDKIAVLRSSINKELPDQTHSLIAIVSDFPVESDLPRFDHTTIQELSDFLIQRMDNKKKKQLYVRVNGKRIPTNPFVEEIIGNILTGALATLKGIEHPIQAIQLYYDRHQEDQKK
jgi:molybdopterin-guanine dinucleotide biosynthesis adapter protein